MILSESCVILSRFLHSNIPLFPLYFPLYNKLLFLLFPTNGMLERNNVDSIVLLSISLINVFKSYRKGRRKIEFENGLHQAGKKNISRKIFLLHPYGGNCSFLSFLLFSPLPLSIIRSTGEGTQPSYTSQWAHSDKH